MILTVGQGSQSICYLSRLTSVCCSTVHVQEELMVRAVTLQEQLTATQTELREVGAMRSGKFAGSGMSGAGVGQGAPLQKGLVRPLG